MRVLKATGVELLLAGCPMKWLWETCSRESFGGVEMIQSAEEGGERDELKGQLGVEIKTV